MFLSWLIVRIVVGGARVSCSLLNLCADQRLIIQLETHAESRSIIPFLDVVIIWTRVLISSSHILSFRGTEAPRGQLILLHLVVWAVVVGRRIVALTDCSFLFTAHSRSNSPPRLSLDCLGEHWRVLSGTRIKIS